MNYHQYYPVDIVNGPGTRCTLFVSGCVHECPGCYNKSTWRLNSGMPFTAEMEDRIINDLNDTRIKRQGISDRKSVVKGKSVVLGDHRHIRKEKCSAYRVSV